MAAIAGALLSAGALAQQGIRPGDADPYATRPGAPNPYATRGGDPNPAATKAGDPYSGRIQQREERRGASKERSTGYAKDPHGEHLPYGTAGGARKH